MRNNLQEIIALQHSLHRRYDMMLHAIQVFIGRNQSELKCTLANPYVPYGERIRTAIHIVKDPPLSGGGI
jgi:hypothetical protein